MGDLNVPRTEADAIKTIDSSALDRLVDQCICEGQATALRALCLDNCGLYISAKLGAFECALANHAKARAATKRAETEYSVRKAGRDLEHAVQEMKARVATQEQESQLFFVDDHIAPPAVISTRLSVTVSFQWRESAEMDWKYGRVTFLHNVVFLPDYLTPAPKRKPSVAQQRRDREDELYRQWEHLRSLALQEVRDHFRRGGGGSAIPESVQARTDPHTHGLNNLSARF